MVVKIFQFKINLSVNKKVITVELYKEYQIRIHYSLFESCSQACLLK